MMKKVGLWLVVGVSMLMGGTTPSPLQRADIQRDLNTLIKRGYTHRMLSDDIIELTEPVSGAKQLKSLREPNETEIRSWASRRNIPILEIDPNTIDTSQYAGWFRYWSQVPLSNTNLEPVVVGDANRNGKAEVYGLWWNYGANQASWIVEVDTNGGVSFLHDFSPRMGIAQSPIDSDNDSLYEFTITYGGRLIDFEQQDRTSLPITSNFEHQRYYSLDPGYTGLYFGNLDDDRFLDFLYKGSEIDSLGDRTKVYVAEYDSQAHNFVRVWSTDYGRHGNVSGFGGFAVNDFDHDGRREFAVAEMRVVTNSGRVYMVENVSNNSFVPTWQDSVPIANPYYVGQGDIDGDGFPELFLGATPGDGNWTVVIEADSNDNYSPRLILHLLSGGLFDVPQYLTTDVDGDGKLELVICAGSDIYIFKANADNQYYLWYLKRENARDGIQFYDFNRDGRKDFIVSKNVWVDPPGYPRNYSDIYVGTSLVAVCEQYRTELSEPVVLHSNYPNPFNPTTTISYALPVDVHVTLKVYDVLGREVITLVDGFVEAGYHQTPLNAANLTSGVYFYRISAGAYTDTKKLLLLR